MQWLMPKGRFRTDHYFSPVNIALSLLFLKLFLAPILAMLVGVTNDLFVRVPSRDSMNLAVVIDLLAYVAFCVGLAITPESRSSRDAASSTMVTDAFVDQPGPLLAMIFAVVGLLGFFLAFGSPARLFEYFLEPSAVTELQQEFDGNWRGFLGILLRPFLAFALVAWWARSADRPRNGRASWAVPMLTGAIACVGIVVTNMTFSFNRAAFVFPVLALVAVFNSRVRRIPLLATVGAFAVVLPLLFALGNYRAKMMAPKIAGDGSAFETTLRETSDTVQSYSGGPPLAGLFFEETGGGARLFGGSTLVASALSPIPILGKGFRDSNGSAIYNQALYGVEGFEDQIIPLSAELFVNFHSAGVVVGFLLLGIAIGRAELRFSAAGSSFGAFAIQYISIWGAMLCVWSLSVFSQIAFYFLGPIYVYWAAVRARVWLRRVAVPRAAVSFS
jgi:hypothetical protein